VTLRSALLLLALLAPAARAQDASASTLAIPLGLHIGVPQGEFAQNVHIAGGFGGGLLVRMAGPLAFRADLGFMIYGSETRRVPLGGGALGLIDVDVTTTNSIVSGGIGAQLGMPSRSLSPYLGGEIGFSAFVTSSSVRGSNSSNEPFASSTNHNDGTFAKTVMAGLYIPVGQGTTVIDLGVRHTWNGERVRYLTPGDITEDVNGDVILSPRETRADLFTIVLGVAITPGGKRR